MAAMLNSIFSPGEIKIVVTLILLAVGITFIVRRQPPKLIRNMNIAPEEKARLKNSIGLLTVAAAVLYPVEVVLSAMNIGTKDFAVLFWSGGLIVISILLMLLVNYYQKK